MMRCEGREKCAGLLVVMIALSVAATLAVAPGCAISPEAQLLGATDAYATTLNLLADYRRAGLLDDEQAAEIERWRIGARLALDAWQEALEANDSEPETAIETYNRLMQALTQALIAAERSPPHGN